MDVKRYDATVEYGPGWDAGASAVMDEAADGDWVAFTDYAAVEAECDRLRTERDRLSEQVRDLEESWTAFAVMTHGLTSASTRRTTMPDDTLDLNEIERLAKAADTREDHPGYTDAPLYAMNDYLTPARVLDLVERAGQVGELRSALENIATTLGGTVTPGASHEFHLMVPIEVEAWRKKADALSARIATLEADLRDIGAALCTSDGILIQDKLNNLERIESLHRVLKLAFDARKRAEADAVAATREAEICKAIIKHCGGSFVVKCMLCGAPYDVRDPDWLKHDLTCPKHPMRDVERERDALALGVFALMLRVAKNEGFELDEDEAAKTTTLEKAMEIRSKMEALGMFEAAGLMGEGAMAQLEKAHKEAKDA